MTLSEQIQRIESFVYGEVSINFRKERKNMSEMEYFIDETVKSSELEIDDNVIDVIKFFHLECKSRKLEFKIVRQIAMYSLIKRKEYLTLERIGKYFNRDHATALHSFRMVEKMLSVKDPLYLKYHKAFYELFENVKLVY